MIKLIQAGGEGLGNQLLQNAGLSILAKKFNFCVDRYFSLNEVKILNMNLFSGTRKELNYKLYTDNELILLVNTSSNLNHGILYKGVFQNIHFLTQYRSEIKNLFTLPQSPINNDVFIHVRLHDTEQFNPGIEYYEEVLKQLNFNKVYISSDVPDSTIIQKLVNKYNMQLINDTPANTINFGRQCSNIIMSNGTFSWWIAFLSDANNIFYPKTTHKEVFHPFIYFSDWNGV